MLLAGSTSMFAQWGRPVDYSAGPGLKDAYKDYFTVGVAVNQMNVSDADQIAIIKKQFNSVTAENDWKPGEIHPKEGEWNFEKADKIANFCRENGIKMRGHCLCWHSQFADWMFTDKKGKPVKKEVFYQRLREHIHTVVNRYKDVVYAWDVVNEAMADDGRPFEFVDGKMVPASPYRQSRHFKLCGDEFIAKAFEFAREADPKGVLIYNDYSCVDEGKRERIYNMVKKMKDAGVPIDGIGMQGHYNIYFPDEAQLEKAISRFSEIVNIIHITELDLRTNTESGGQLRFSRGEAKPQAPYIQTLQEDQYARLFKIFRKHKDVIKNVTFWNLSDKDSWLGTNNHPLPFDENFKAKRSLQIIRDFNTKLDNYVPKEDFVSNPMNQPGQEYPMVNSEGYARFRVVAPDAKSVIVSLGQVLQMVLWILVSTTITLLSMVVCLMILALITTLALAVGRVVLRSLLLIRTSMQSVLIFLMETCRRYFSTLQVWVRCRRLLYICLMAMVRWLRASRSAILFCICSTDGVRTRPAGLFRVRQVSLWTTSLQMVRSSHSSSLWHMA